MKNTTSIYVCMYVVCPPQLKLDWLYLYTGPGRGECSEDSSDHGVGVGCSGGLGPSVNLNVLGKAKTCDV